MKHLSLTVASPQLPYTTRRQHILDEIDRYGCVYVNCRYRVQLRDRSCQRSRDIRRMIKNGDVKLVRDGLPRSRYTKVIRS